MLQSPDLESLDFVLNKGKVEPLSEGELSTPDVAWNIHVKCNKKVKIAYGPWADRQR